MTRSASSATIGADQAGQDRRVVAEVGVHLDDDRGAAGERHARSRRDTPGRGPAWPPVADPDPRVGGGQTVGQLAGAVGRAVVDDEQRRARAARSRIAAAIGRRFSASL